MILLKTFIAFAIVVLNVSLAYSQDSLEGLSAHQQSERKSINALNQLRLSIKIDGIWALKNICINAKDPHAFSSEEIMAATGYDLAAVPFEAIRKESSFCQCAIYVTALANLIAASALGVDGVLDMPNYSDLRDSRVMHRTSSCRSGAWRVDFETDGLALSFNGAPVFGGRESVVAGRKIENDSAISNSWVEQGASIFVIDGAQQ